MKTKLLLMMLVVLALAGCSDALTGLVNKKFPPIDEAAQRQAALDGVEKALSSMTSPSVGVGIGLPMVSRLILDDKMRKEGIASVELKGDEQLLRVAVSFKRTFDEKDAGDDENLKRLLSLYKPEVEGFIEVFAGLNGAIDKDVKGDPVLVLKLLPGISRIHVDKLKIANSMDASNAVNVLADMLMRYKDNIAGEITRAKFATATLPLASDKPLDIARAMKINTPGGSAEVALTGSPIQLPVKLDSVAWLIDSEQVIALIQLTPLDAKPEHVKVDKAFGPIKHQFSSLVSSAFKLGSDTQTWVAVRKELIATVVNTSVAQANACVAAKGATHMSSSSKIPMPSGAGIDCSSGRDCESKRRCSFDMSKDERSCSTCLISRPVLCAPKLCGFGGCIGGGCTGGGCAQTGNDPICEIAKAGQNEIYKADANFRKADCDRLRAMETAGCQVEEVAAKGLCEAGKATLNALRRTGNFANVDVDANLKSDGIKICLQSLSVSPGLDRIAFVLDATGEAQADVDVKFTPLDIAGHLACQFPWSERKTFEAQLRDSRIPFEAQVQFVTTPGSNPRLSFTTKKTTIKAKVSPGPTEYLLTTPMMNVSCSGLNLVRPLVVGLTPFLKELRGEIDYDVDQREVSVEVPLSKLDVGGRAITIAATQNDRALVMSAIEKK